MRFAAIMALFAATLIGASAAQAAQRYAAPGGTGTGCSQSSPCSLAQAITGSSANDEVIVTAGTYSVGSTISVPGGANDVYIHGEFGGSKPRIEAALTGAAIAFSAFRAHLSYLEFINTGPTSPVGVYCPHQGEVDRVSSTATGTNAVANLHYPGDCEIRDSFLRAEGSDAIALSVAATATDSGIFTHSARNLTAIAGGPSAIGIRSYYGSNTAGSITLDLTNSIVSGSRTDLLAAGISGEGNIVVSNSNLDEWEQNGGRVIPAGVNQTTPPLFVDAIGGDYREAAGSPTIDAGSNVGIGPLDLDGNPRTLGAAADIGAYEYVPPAPPPPPPPGQLRRLALQPKAFRPVNAGGAIFSRASKQRRKKRKIKIGTTVRYSLTAPAAVRFIVQRKVVGRKAGGKCRRVTRKNRKRRRCIRWIGRGGFRVQGTSGVNRFKFTGRLRGKRLRRGRYRLVARTHNPNSVRRAGFRIVR